MGLLSDSSNTVSDAHDDGSLTVAKIRAPSTPFSSDTDPLNDFHFSGRNDVVTVKDVEEIVEAVKNSFAKFIEVQRSYLDNQQSSESSADSSESKNSTDANTSSQTSNSVETSNKNDSSSTGLTEAAVSDIIEAISERNDFLNSEIQNSISDLKSGLSSKLDSLSSEISEKLIESSSENEDKNQKNTSFSSDVDSETIDNGTFSSFVEFILNSNEEIESKIDVLQESVNSISKNNNTEYDSSQKKNISQDISQIPISTDVNSIDIEEFKNRNIYENGSLNDSISQNSQENNINESLISKTEDFLENLFSDVEKMFLSNNIKDEENDITNSNIENSTSTFDIVSENNELIKVLKTDIDEISNTIAGISNNGIAKSMVELMVQNSMIQMLTSNTIEGISTMMNSRINEKFGDLIHVINETNKNSISKKDENDENLNTKNSNLSDTNDNDNSRFSQKTKIETFKTEIENNQNKFDSENSDTKEEHVQSTESNMVDVNDKNNFKKSTYENEDTSKNGSLIDFIENAFDSFISLFRGETSKNEKNDNTDIGSINSSVSDGTSKETIISPSSVFSIDEEENPIKITEYAANENASEDKFESTDISNNFIDYDSFPIDEMMQNVESTNENILNILNKTYENDENLLSDFQKFMDGFDENSKGFDDSIHNADLNSTNLLSYLLSEEENIIEEINQINSSIASLSERNNKERSDVINTSENSFSTQSFDSKNVNNSDETIIEEVVDNRKIMMERFDKLESTLQSYPSKTSTQVVYVPMNEHSFEVDRIG